jgi:hypothetical protein
MCFLWGIQDSISMSNTCQILGFEFETESEPFGVFQIVQGLSMAVFYVIQIFIDTTTPRPIIVYNFAITFFGIFCCLVTYTMEFKVIEKTKSTIAFQE